jgi:suppressor of ftsI
MKICGPAWILAALIPLSGGARAISAWRPTEGVSRAVACPEGPGAPAPSAPNFCTDLIPTPDLQAVTAILALRPVETPFGVGVTRDGRPRYRLAVSISGLPAPRTLGRYSSYVAWATTLSLDSVVKLGPVRNGETRLPELASSQFRILVSAESSAAVAHRSGRLVLRGTSPGTRLLAHRDVLQPFGMGRSISSPSPDHPTPPAGDAHRADSRSAMEMAWPMPPMDVAATMMPAMSGLEPTASPWRAGEAIDARDLPDTLPHQTRHLRSGDTLAITVSLVRRSIDGRTFAAYAYNGQIPGPLIVVPQGATITVPVYNRTDLPTTIHWHGVRVDNGSDGADGITQDAIPTGGRFTYRVHFPDAGLYWYHAHHREDIAQPLGLYGNILVTPPGSSSRPAPVNQEEVMTIGDVLLDSAGPAPWGAERPTHALMGRYGNVMLVNGQWRPQWSVQRGAVVRFYLTNVSTARPYNLSFGNARIKVVGSDAGRFEREAWAASVVIAPAERYIVDVLFAVPGETVLTNCVEALSHMTGAIYPEVDTLATIHVSTRLATPDHSVSFAELHTDAETATELARYRPFIAQPVTHRLWLQQHLRNLPLPIAAMLNALSVPVDWNDGMGMMNWVLTPHEVTWVIRDPSTGAEDMDVAWQFRQGTVVKVRISNDAAMPHAMAHAIHLHGQRFLVVARNGLASDDLVWKDTALIPAGETVDLLLDLANPGRWLLHCHIAEHMEANMMMTVTVDPRTT